MKDHTDKKLAEIARQDDHISYKKVGHIPKRGFWHWFFGRPLASADADHQTIGKAVGLAVFASDALSSTAYATQEILVILALAGMGALQLSVPLSFVIVALLIIVTVSYEQIIHAYPNGGGAYIVARENLGEWPALVAAASLLMDYVLTVAVSTSSGVAQLVSAVPVLLPFQIEIALVMVSLITLVNLRGVRESGAIFSVLAYAFILLLFGTLAVGFMKYFTGSLPMVIDPPEMEMLGEAAPLTVFLVLRAFANGTAALTGIEAISNGITAFKQPRSRNAGITLVWMAGILSVLFLGITFLSHHIGAVPSEFETVISQLVRTVFGGRDLLYYLAVGATTIILFMAANTAFAGFPRLGALVAGDGFLPRQLSYRGSRLVYSRGIVVLALVASLLVVVFRARVSGLIPLYAIGVFLSFTLSQAGMARRWWKVGKLKPVKGKKKKPAVQPHGEILTYEPHWAAKMLINGFGAICTGIVMLIFAVTKFQEGAWLVLVLLPFLMAGFIAVHNHYKDLAQHLTLDGYKSPAPIKHQKVIMPISGVHRGTLSALRYAQSLSKDVTVLHVAVDAEAGERVLLKWQKWAPEVNLVVLGSPYRLLLEPILSYVKTIADNRKPNEIVTVVVPEFLPRVWWHSWLHTRAAQLLRMKLLFTNGVVVVEVPYVVD
ncbi:MAG TPA: APC family permease [Anaerolineales bacterium]|nr:APC family permease [Anaerolineales bacterium]HRQ91293.1 APC family permease [Anaerolineales bacterium]